MSKIKPEVGHWVKIAKDLAYIPMVVQGTTGRIVGIDNDVVTILINSSNKFEWEYKKYPDAVQILPL